MPGPGVLFVDGSVPRWDRDGGSVRAYDIMRLLVRLGRPVTFLPKDGKRLEPYSARLAAQGIAVRDHDGDPAPIFAELGPRLGAVLVARPEGALRFMALARRHAPGAALLYDSVDLHWVRLEAGARLLGDPEMAGLAARARRAELAAAAFADVAVAVTGREAALLAEALPGRRVVVVPAVGPRGPAPPPCAGREGLVFLGSLLHRPNLDALEVLLGPVLAAVQAGFPGIRLTVVGEAEPGLLEAVPRPGVEFLGPVPDPVPHLDAARVMVCPMRFGAGMKVKIAHALARGLPVVTTPCGAEGMDLVDGSSAMIAEGPEGLARAAVRLCTDDDLWGRISAEGIRLAARSWSEDVVLASLRALVG